MIAALFPAPRLRLGVLNEGPRRRCTAIRRHAIALRDRCGRRSVGRAPNAAFRAGFARAGSSTNGLFHGGVPSSTARRRVVRINPYDFVRQDKSLRRRMIHSMSESKLGVRLRALRMKKKLSLQELADKIGASKAHVWDLEQGKTRNPSLGLLTELSRALEVSIAELVGEGEETAGSENPQLAPLFRDLRGLTPEQLDLIRTMTEKLREMKDGNKSDG